MKLHQKFTLYFVALIIVFSLAIETFASCPMTQQGPPCQEFWQSQAVFVGVATRVVRISNETLLMTGQYARSTVHFSVEEAFKGVEGTVVVFDLDYCGYFFKEGERYLVYAHYNSYAKKLDVRAGNTRTRPLSEAGEDLAYIRSLPSAEAGSRVFGKVQEQSLNVKESRFDDGALTGIKVSLEGNNEYREVTTDNEGKYEFKGLQAGTYRIRAETPSHLSYQEQTIKVTGRGCVPLHIYATGKGQIAGRILDLNGNPIRGVPVSLVSADATPEQILSERKDKGAWTWGFTNPDGSFSFSQLAPGRYLLIINRAEFERSLGSELARALPRFFYPGVSDLKGATVIVVSKDEKPQKYDFLLPIQ
jgi:hypothetical protein